MYNTKKNVLIQFVWEKGQKLSYKDPNVWRLDSCGALIKRDDYGKKTEFGWEIDHVIPVAKGGKDVLINYQPLQWENNRAKSDGLLTTTVRASHGRNLKDPYENILFS